MRREPGLRPRSASRTLDPVFVTPEAPSTEKLDAVPRSIAVGPAADAGVAIAMLSTVPVAIARKMWVVFMLFRLSMKQTAPDRNNWGVRAPSEFAS